MKNHGHINLSRIFEEEPFRDYSAKELRLVIYLIFRLRWQNEPASFFLGDKEFFIQKGQYAVTQRRLTDEYNSTCKNKKDRYDRATLWRFMRVLKMNHALNHEIFSHLNQESTIISALHPEVCKFFQINDEPRTLNQNEPQLEQEMNHSVITNNSSRSFKKENVKKKKSKIISFSFSSTKEEEDFQIIKMYSEERNLNISDQDIKNWLKKYESLVGETFSEMIKSPKTNPSGWMQRVLQAKYNFNLNVSFVNNFRNEKKWSSLTITKLYCRDEMNGKDYYFKMPHENFVEEIQRNFETHKGIL